ncbi:MAG: AAA family ATPase [Thermoproteales archaeon]|nr:AAA family ATPase [Thermoproteales archaeon]
MERLRTGIPGLDEVLGGGIIKDTFLLIAGPSGTGKTIMCLQMTYNHLKEGKKAIYVSFDEGKRLLDYAKLFGWDFKKYIEEEKFILMDFVAIKAPAITDTINFIIEKIQEINADLVVIDSLTTLIMSMPELSEARIAIDFLRKMKPEGTTLIATANMSTGSKRIGLGIEEIVACTVILLKRYIVRGEIRTKLLVLKMRGSAHSKRFHDVIITNSGVQVMPLA